MTIAISAVCAAAIGLLVVLILKRDHHSAPHPPEDPAPVAEPASPAPSAVAHKAVPPRPAVAVARPGAPASAKPEAAKPPSEESLLAQLHDLAASDPNLSLKLAREAVNRFPDSPNAPEFEWNVVKALFNLGRLEDAKAEAQIMLAKYPGSYFTGDVVHHLLNPPPNPSDVQ